MNPISVARDQVSAWLDQAVDLLSGPKKTLSDDEPLSVPDHSLDEGVIGNLVASPPMTARAEPEQAKPVVVREPLTNNPLEAPLTRTEPSTRALVTALEKAWPELTEVGARTLAAQHGLETGDGSASWNWNLGNMKATADQPHVYLGETSEVVPESAALDLVNRGKGLAHVADADEMARKGWSCPAGSRVVVFDPPHDVSRFAAYKNLAEGASAWASYYQTHVATRAPNILASLNAGDTLAVAHDLKQAGYYTSSEADYAAGLASERAEVDAAIGWSP